MEYIQFTKPGLVTPSNPIQRSHILGFFHYENYLRDKREYLKNLTLKIVDWLFIKRKCHMSTFLSLCKFEKILNLDRRKPGARTLYDNIYLRVTLDILFINFQLVVKS